MKALEATILQHPFLERFSTEDQEHFFKNAHEVEFESNEVIFQDGDPANRCFLIQSGEIAIEVGTGAKNIVQTLESGDVLGWSWLFPPFSWHGSARATKATKCIVIDGAHLLVRAESDPQFGYDLMKRISQVLIGRLQRMQKLLEEPA
jgi:CRP/FNR family cyclic AMP-dependent transcriptional regulator